MDGLGNLLSGLAATTVGASATELTGVGARSVGVAAGAVFVAVAFLPTVFAVVLAIPGPVFAACLGVLLASLFAIGMKMAVQDGLDYRKGLIAGGRKTLRLPIPGATGIAVQAATPLAATRGPD